MIFGGFYILSGIDEQRAESCACVYEDTAQVTQQYWLVYNVSKRSLGYFNPDAFRKPSGREDVLNTQIGSKWTRKQIVDNTDEYLSTISCFECSNCGNIVRKREYAFEEMLGNIRNFITGSIFPKLDGGV